MKTIYVQKQVIGWEEFTYEVSDDFDDYESLTKNSDWTNWEYIEDSGVETGLCEIYDSDYNKLFSDD